MMNAARLSVGVQGVAVGETALQAAEALTVERLQGRASTGCGKAADAIIHHPDIRRELIAMRALVEGGRAVAWWISLELDIAIHDPQTARRRKAEAFLALVTPIFKAAMSDWGFDVANRAVMIHGGHGYIREMGVEQLVRDIRIAAIYEGTNGTQARDLVLRKLPAEDGAAVAALFTEIREFLAERKLPSIDEPRKTAVVKLEETSDWLRHAATTDADAALAGAGDYLQQFAIVLIGYLWAWMARAATCGTEPFLIRKVETAAFYLRRILPKAAAFATAAVAGNVPSLARDRQSPIS